MDANLLIFAVALFLLLSTIAVFLRLYFFNNNGFFSGGNLPNTTLPNSIPSSIPNTVAERRRLMTEEGADGPMFRAIKLASYANTASALTEPWILGLMRRAGISEENERVQIRIRAIAFFVAGIMLGGAAGASATFSISFIACGLCIGAIAGIIAPLQELSIRARLRELDFMQAIGGLLRPLIITLDRGLDLTTSIKELVAGAAMSKNIVIELFEQASATAQERGIDVRSVFKESALVVGSKSYSRLVRVLTLSDSHAAGWRMQLEHFASDLEDCLFLLDADNGKGGSKGGSVKKNDPMRPENFFPKKKY